MAHPLAGATLSDLRGRSVVVTGGSRGIGRAIVDGFTDAGSRVLSLDRDPLPEGSPSFRCDVADERDVAAAFTRVAEELGGLDVLVNNAGLFTPLLPRRGIEDIALDEWERAFATNARGVFLCCRAALPLLRARRGAIVNVASSSVFAGMPNLVHYVSSKGAVLALTRALAREVGPTGVRVNAVAPGLVETESVIAAIDADYRAAQAAKRAIPRVATPDEIVGAVLFLASDAARAITGQTIIVDGGQQFA